MFRVILVTAPPAAAGKLARQLLRERLIACANLLPGVRSLYWWKGRMESARETLILMKTPARQVSRLMRRIRQLHPYEVPEIVALPVARAHKPYAEWVAAEARPGKRDAGRKGR